ncbi:SPARC-like, partial [Xyrauchen texanus]|uniref:SPARC-like n=1 Tax=Xyrauchen texanus TaxID=154827 RepID=UPI002241C927
IQYRSGPQWISTLTLDPSINPVDRRCQPVCGTDNKTYDISCQLFATKIAFRAPKRAREFTWTTLETANVQKIYESERRLHAGDHPIELLLQNFEKIYNMYIYPVHWQFAQMDQHPSDSCRMSWRICPEYHWCTTT